MLGVAKWFSNQKGFGFITPEDGTKDVFVHHSNILIEGYHTLAEGQEVEFEIENAAKGIRAIQVKPIGEIISHGRVEKNGNSRET